jgi:enamine deaminase RidA (YjgF/YER057c/UK114 family)
MSIDFDARLAELGISLPTANSPLANYVAARRCGNVLYISGQVPRIDGRDAFVGKLGQELTVEQGREAARICAINILAQVRAALGGSLNGIAGCIRLGGFVNSAPEFGDQPSVINGASDLMVEVFGDAGRHARAAVGCASLPRNVAVEVDAVFELR